MRALDSPDDFAGVQVLSLTQDEVVLLAAVWPAAYEALGDLAEDVAEARVGPDCIDFELTLGQLVMVRVIGRDP